jgi:VanZ like family/Concanavalin A-like lectin/glucanases superfamily
MDEGRQTPREHTLLAFLGCVVVVGILFCTLWPFNPFPPNHVYWLPDTRGIRFENPGVVVSNLPLAVQSLDLAKSSTLELMLEPAAIDRASTILSFYSSDNQRQFRLRQWTDGLLISRRVPLPGNKTKSEKFDIDHALRLGKTLALTIVSSEKGTVVYLDGRETQVVSKFKFIPGDLSGQLVLGTAVAEYQPWAGVIRGLAIYSKALTSAEVLLHYENWTVHLNEFPNLDGAVARYAFTQGTGREIRNEVASAPALEIPANFRVPHKPFLSFPIREYEAKWGYWNDLLQNIVGFMPLGFLLCAYLMRARSRKRAILFAVLSGGLLSLTIEVLQYFIPRRNSGMTDIITNTLGTLLGALLSRPSLVQGFLRRMNSLVPWAKAGGDVRA